MLTRRELKKRAKNGNVRAMYLLAGEHETIWSPKDQRIAYLWYRSAADQGYVPAFVYVGAHLSDGCGVKKNVREAVLWFRRGANAGDASSMVSYGYHLFYGEGVRKDRAEAVRWYRRAARKHEGYAYFNLALCYYKGHVVSQNYRKAAGLFKKAERRKWYYGKRAQDYLADFYEKGLGVRKSARWARYWREKAEGIRASNGELATPEYYKRIQDWIKYSCERDISEVQMR